MRGVWNGPFCISYFLCIERKTGFSSGRADLLLWVCFVSDRLASHVCVGHLGEENRELWIWPRGRTFEPLLYTIWWVMSCDISFNGYLIAKCNKHIALKCLYSIKQSNNQIRNIYNGHSKKWIFFTENWSVRLIKLLFGRRREPIRN